MNKRFKHNGSMIFDGEKPLTTIEVVDLLNMFDYENKELKEDNAYYHETYWEYEYGANMGFHRL